MFDEIKELTCRMVAIPSINATPGERAIGLFIEDYIRNIPYFQSHPEYVYVVPLKDDPLERQNVAALLKGTAEGNDGRTILCHGHTDTVGVDDFGKLEPLAFSCKELMDALKAMDLEFDVKADLDSGDWLFGRGICDMKSGVAVFLVLLRHLSEHPERLKGNLLFAFNPVEENLHTGILETLPLLQQLQKTEGLRYLFAVNNDYTCPAYAGDPNHYIYAGAVGKLLPCFYIQGKETHVGQCFEGFDAVTIMTELIREINLNPEFCDVYDGESTLPPSVLYSRDMKDFYNVQTAASAVCYFNYFVHNAGFKEIVSRLKQSAKKAIDVTESELNRKYAAFCKVAGICFEPISYTKQVYTYQELIEAAREKAPEQVNAALEDELQAGIEAGEDKRLLPIRMIRKLLHMVGITTPVVVMYFAAPYCPHTTLKDENAKGGSRLSGTVRSSPPGRLAGREKHKNDAFLS